MVKIRLSRFGKHKSPFYRIVAIDSRSKRDGEYLELLGTYNPDKKLYTLKNEQIINFLKEGAQPTETVLNILKAHGIWKLFTATKPAKVKPSTKKAPVAKPAVE